jgi:hypothetical protein
MCTMKIFKIVATVFFTLPGLVLSGTPLTAQNPDVSALPLDIVATWQADRSIVFDAADVDLDALKWIARPLVVFADSPFDPSFIQQMELLLERVGELALRDVMIIADTDPANPSQPRMKLRPRGFMMTLLGKDGGVQLRKPSPRDVRELSRSIDKTPMRKQEISEGRNVNPLFQQ